MSSTQSRHAIHSTLDQLGAYRRETKVERARIGQCLYTIFSGNIEGLRIWREWCNGGKVIIPPNETFEFWLTAKEASEYDRDYLQRLIQEDK